MKRTEKLLSTLLMVAMFITSVGLLYASIYASGGGTQSTFGSVVFEKETGIRYNNLTGEFEVFNEAGVSWIASNRFISVEGVVEPSSVTVNPDSTTHQIADGNKVYNIMRDIGYTGSVSGENIYNASFDTSKITLGTMGILDGRGFTLKNFRVKAQSQAGKSIGSAIVAINNGTIRNLNVSNSSFTAADSGDAAGIICGINNGIIDGSAVYGTDGANTYQTNQYTGLYAIAAITSGKISNSVNNANLDNTKANSLAAGIASVLVNASLLNNTNNGNITSTSHASGIAIDSSGVAFIVRGNVNNGTLNADTSVSGIVGGGAELSVDARGNTNNGDLDSDEIYELYYGVSDIQIEIPIYGISYNASINGTGGFQIYNADGISWISSGATFDEAGNKDTGTGVVANGAAYYEIHPAIKTIDYNEKGSNFDAGSGTFNTAFYGGSYGNAPSIAAGGVFNGNDRKIKNFPLRQCGTGSIIREYYSTLFYENGGTIRNLVAEINSTDVTGITGTGFAGGIVGLNSGNSALISTVTLNGTLRFGAAGGYLGGLIGGEAWTAGQLITNVVCSLTLSGANVIGGIAGTRSGDVTLSTFSGEIASFDGRPLYSGGIVGSTGYDLYGDTITITDCTVSGLLYGEKPGVLIGLDNWSTAVQNQSMYERVNYEGCVLRNLSGVNMELKMVCVDEMYTGPY